MTDWVKKAGKTKIREKAQAIVDAVDEALWKDNPRFNAEYRAASAALLEALNQAQNGQGMVSAADLHLIAMEMKTMTGLSAAAQAVWRAHEQVIGDECVLTKTDMKALAAALQAAADQLTPYSVSEMEGAALARNKLLAIATELEGQ